MAETRQVILEEPEIKINQDYMKTLTASDSLYYRTHFRQNELVDLVLSEYKIQCLSLKPTSDE